MFQKQKKINIMAFMWQKKNKIKNPFRIQDEDNKKTDITKNILSIKKSK